MIWRSRLDLEIPRRSPAWFKSSNSWLVKRIDVGRRQSVIQLTVLPVSLVNPFSVARVAGASQDTIMTHARHNFLFTCTSLQQADLSALIAH
jgi:hypothetical protein